MAPRLAFAALAVAFGIAVIGATLTTAKNLNLTRSHSAYGQSQVATKNKPSELRNKSSELRT
jgi:hypothetical protein